LRHGGTQLESILDVDMVIELDRSVCPNQGQPGRSAEDALELMRQRVRACAGAAASIVTDVAEANISGRFLWGIDRDMALLSSSNRAGNRKTCQERKRRNDPRAKGKLPAPAVGRTPPTVDRPPAAPDAAGPPALPSDGA
jgi:hypothetical protein